MADISAHTASPTVEAIYQTYVDARRKGHRPHLGGSQIGHHCDRYLWYQFHWCERPTFDGRMLRLFDHGNWEEKRIVADLRAIGATVYDRDPDNPDKQITYTEYGGHFGVSLDGVALGLPEAPKTWHVLEFKTANDKSFRSTSKNGVQADKPQHYAQMQVGMHLSGLKRAFYLAVNKNTDELHGERVKYDKGLALTLMDRASRVIFSDHPLDRVSNRPDWWMCKFCEMHKICHLVHIPEVNCRTCAHSTAERDGTWTCVVDGVTLPESKQAEACDAHLFRPSLIGQPLDAGETWVRYEDWTNVPYEYDASEDCYTSRDARALGKIGGGGNEV